MKHLIVVLFSFLMGSLRAQEIQLFGYLRDSVTYFPISNATVVNGTSNKSAFTSNRGFFTISASPNDFIFFYAPSYQVDTLTYAFMFKDTINVYMNLVGSVLPNVIVTANYTRYQLDSIGRRNDFLIARGTAYPVLATNHPSGFGLTFNLENVFKKKYKKPRNQDRLFKQTEEFAYVNYRFSPPYVASLTGLKGDELARFMKQYTPSYDWLRSHPTNEDVLYYVNDKLKAWRKK